MSVEDFDGWRSRLFFSKWGGPRQGNLTVPLGAGHPQAVFLRRALYAEPLPVKNIDRMEDAEEAVNPETAVAAFGPQKLVNHLPERTAARHARLVRSFWHKFPEERRQE